MSDDTAEWLTTRDANALFNRGVCDRTFRDKYGPYVRHTETPGGKLRWLKADVLALASDKGRGRATEERIAERKKELLLHVKMPVVSDGCWLWVGRLDDGGYGPYGEMWRLFTPLDELHVGELHHRCLNRKCVNPAHLVLLSPKEHRAMHNSRGSAAI